MTQEVLQAIPTALSNSLKHISKMDNHVVVEEVRKYINKSLIDGVENEEIVDSVNTMIESLSPFVEESTQDFKDITLTKAIEENIELVDFSTVLRRVAPDKYAPLGNIKVIDQNGKDVADGIKFRLNIYDSGVIGDGEVISYPLTENSFINIENIESLVYYDGESESNKGIIFNIDTKRHPYYEIIGEYLLNDLMMQMDNGVFTLQIMVRETPYLGNIKITDQNGSDVADGIMVDVVSIDENGNRGGSIGSFTTSNSHIDVENIETHIMVNGRTGSKVGLIIEPSTEFHPTFFLVDENAWLLDMNQMVDGVYTVQFNIPGGK